MNYNCDICICKGFKNPGALASHKATSRACKLALLGKGNEPLEHTQLGDRVISTANECIQMIHESDVRLDSLFASQHAHEILSTPVDSFFKAGDPQQRFDSMLHIVAFIRQCQNTMGLSV